MNIHNTGEWMALLSRTLQDVKCRVEGQRAPFETACGRVADLLWSCRGEKSSVWWVGNGGSAAICTHLSQDLVNKFGIRSFHNADPSLLTCMSNDYGYENVYSKPLETLAEPGDLLIAISSSGNSDNILSCVALAEKKQMTLITLSGFKEDNRLWNSSGTVSFYLPATLFGIVEVGHEAILHGIIETLWLKGQHR